MPVFLLLGVLIVLLAGAVSQHQAPLLHSGMFGRDKMLDDGVKADGVI
ncbi:MAG: hypothetical protein ABI611_08210 [Solirubrobacteraceae bacterium]